jgi:Putative transposase
MIGAEARRERLIYLAWGPDPGPLLRTLIRLRHDLVMLGRAAIEPLPETFQLRLTFKDYRVEGPGRYKIMTLATPEFIRRFLMHVLPKGFHRIRHAGFLANGNRAEAIAKACQQPLRPRKTRRRPRRPNRSHLNGHAPAVAGA